jgi:D-psicose/D-tagatose/L-ribulose 3-epimerase
VTAALKKIDYDGALVIESFTTLVKEIAKAAAIWRPPAPNQDMLAREGLAFLRKLMA